MWTRCRLFEQLGDKKRMLEQMMQISKNLKPEDGEVGFQIARDIAKAMYDNSDIDQAIATMEKTFEKHPNYITSEGTEFLNILDPIDYYKRIINYQHSEIRCQLIVRVANKAKILH